MQWYGTPTCLPIPCCTQQSFGGYFALISGRGGRGCRWEWEVELEPVPSATQAGCA